MYIDRVIEYNTYQDREVEQVIEKQVEVVRNVDIAIDRVVTKYVEVPIETYRDVIEEREIIIPVDRQDNHYR